MDKHKLAAVIGIVVLALGVVLILPFVKEGSFAGKAVTVTLDVQQDYVAYFPLDEIERSSAGVNYVASANLGIDSDGDTILDDSFKGTLAGATLNDEAVKGKALAFGGNDIVSVMDNAPLQRGTQQTVAVWYKWDGVNTKAQRLVGKDSIGTPMNYGLWVVPGTKNILFQRYLIPSSGARASSYCAAVKELDTFDTEWHQLTGTYDGSTIKLYLDGAWIAESPCVNEGEVSVGGVVFGKHPDPSFDYFTGLLDEVYLYARPLVPIEIQALASVDNACFNSKACTIAPDEISNLGGFTDAGNDYKETNDALTALGVTPTGISDLPVDLRTNAVSFSATSGHNNMDVTISEAATDVANFRYGGNNYVVQLYKYDAVQGVVELKVKDLATGTDVGGVIQMEITQNDPLHFIPRRTELNLIGASDSQPEVFLKTFAYYNNIGQLGLIVVATPNIDLNSLATGSTTLRNGMNEQFLFSDGKHYPLTFIQSGDAYVVIVGAIDSNGNPITKQYNSGTITELNDDVDGDGLLEFTHYIDPAGTSGVTFNVNFSGAGWLSLDLEKFPAGLDGIYEKVMTQNKVIRFGDFNLKICPEGITANSDVSDWRVVKVCNNDVYKFSLLADEAKSAKDLGVVNAGEYNADGSPKADQQAVFWFPDQEGVKADKEVYVFKYRDVTDKSVLEEGSTFSNNLVKGRRMAFLLEDDAEGKQYYLLSHEGTGLLNFNNLKVIAMHKPELYSPLPDSDRERALFNLPVDAFRAASKQLNIRRLITSTTASYNISGVTAVLRSVNLTKELQTGISTYGSVDVQGLGLVRLSTSDVVTTSRTMDIRVGPKTDLTRSTPYQLDLEVAQAIPRTGDTINTGTQKFLFHYETFREETARGADNPHTKVADVFLLYDLGVPTLVAPNGLTAQHPFSDMDFTVPILKGKQLALRWDGKYYLLGYNEGLQWSETVRENPRGFFEEEKLELRTLGQRGKLRARYVPEEKTAYFDLPDGDKINVTFDDTINLDETINNKFVRFSAEDFIPTAITDFNPEKEFEANLPEQSQTEVFNQLKVLNAAGTTAGLFRNCDNRGYSNRPEEIIVCTAVQTSDNGEVLNKSNNPREDIVPGYAGTVPGAKVLVTLKNRLSQYNKEVSFQYLLPALPAANLVQNLDWLNFTDLLLAGKSPAIKLNNGYFEITGTDQFGSLKLVNISQTAEQYPITHYQQGVKDNEGLVVINENLFGFKQFEDASRTDRLRIDFEEFKLVNTNGLSLGADDEVDFITTIEADVQENIYALQLSPADVYANETGPSEVNVLIQEVGYSYPLNGPAVRGSPGRVFFQGDVPLSVEKVILLHNGDRIKVSPTYQKDQAGNLVTNAAGEVQLIVKVVKLP